MPQTLAKLDIANLALALIGQKPIASADTAWALTTEAAKVKAVWETARLTALRDHVWKFARERVALTAVSTETYDGYDYVWDYPTDAVVIRKVFVDATAENPDPVTFAQFRGPAGKKVFLATNARDAENKCYAEITYGGEGAQAAEYLNYDPTFVMAFAAQIGYLVAGPLTGDDKIMAKMATLYQGYINTAKNRDAREERILSTRKGQSTIISARG